MKLKQSRKHFCLGANPTTELHPIANTVIFCVWYLTGTELIFCFLLLFFFSSFFPPYIPPTIFRRQNSFWAWFAFFRTVASREITQHQPNRVMWLQAWSGRRQDTIVEVLVMSEQAVLSCLVQPGDPVLDTFVTFVNILWHSWTSVVEIAKYS